MKHTFYCEKGKVSSLCAYPGHDFSHCLLFSSAETPPRSLPCCFHHQIKVKHKGKTSSKNDVCGKWGAGTLFCKMYPRIRAVKKKILWSSFPQLLPIASTSALKTGQFGKAQENSFMKKQPC